MNARIDNPSPLPPAPDLQRRTRVGPHLVDDSNLARFNSLLLRLDRACPPVNRDQLATAARNLFNRAPGCDHTVAHIHRSMRRASAIDLMLHDADWVPAHAVLAPAQLVVHYVRDASGLIPDTLQRIGRLDDSIVVDVAWPVLRGEVEDYLDFRRVRRVERGLGNGNGNANANGFDRNRWEQARNAEAALIEHCRRVGESSYVDGSAISRFRVA